MAEYLGNSPFKRNAVRREARNRQVERARVRDRQRQVLERDGHLNLHVVAIPEDKDINAGRDAHAVVGVMTLCGRGFGVPRHIPGLEVSCAVCLEVIDAVCEAFE